MKNHVHIPAYKISRLYEKLALKSKRTMAVVSDSIEKSDKVTMKMLGRASLRNMG